MERKGQSGCVPYAVIYNSNGLNWVYLYFTADLGAHDIDHFLAGEHMAFKSRVGHFVFGSAPSKTVKRTWCFPLGIS